MSFVPDRVKLAVKTSNYSSVARFASTLDEAYLLIVANSNNDYSYNDSNNAGIFGANSSIVDNATRYETYIGTKENDIISKIARFNANNINLERNTVVAGNIIPAVDTEYDLGSVQERWRDLFLSGNSIYLNNTVMSSDPVNGSLKLEGLDNQRLPIIAGELVIQKNPEDQQMKIVNQNNKVTFNAVDLDGNENTLVDLSAIKSSLIVEDNSVGEDGVKNIFYRPERVAPIIISSNIETSNYVDLMDSNMSNYMENRTEHFTLVDSNMSNYMENRTEHFTLVDSNMSNYMENRTEHFTLVDSNMSNYMENRTEHFTLVDSNMSNYMENRTEYFTLVDSNMSNYMTATSNIISDRISKLDTDDITQGVHQKFIVDNVWDNDLTISGTLYTSNIRAVGSNTIIFTDIYTTESLGVVSTAEDSDAFIISHSGDGINNVMTATVADEPAMVITHQKLVGIGRSDPSEALDVLGVTKSTEFVGIGSNLTQILTNYSTTELIEGTNLYYTAERVGIIVSSSNVESSNYVDLMDSNMSNYMENRTEYFTLVDSNMSNYMENRTEHFTLVDSNMSNYMTATSNTISQNLSTLDNLVRTDIQTKLDETSNFAIDMDSNVSNYIQNRTEYFTLVDSNMSNYMTATSNTISQNLSTLDNLVRTDIQTKLDETSNFAIDMDSNVSNYIQNRTEYFTLVDSNMSNYMTATSNTISQNLSTLDNLVRTDIQTKLDETSNFAIDMDSNVSNYIQNRTEYFTLVDSNMSNYVENRTEYFTLVDSNMSNYVENRTEYFTLVDSNMSNYVENRTEYFTLVDSNMSNYVENRTEYFTLVDSNMSNYMTATSNVINDRISKLDTDDITQGVHQKFIVDNVWDNDLTISGTLYTSNIRAVGSNTIIFTDIYTTESLGVVSTAEDSDAFIISHSGDGINNVMTATVADEPAMVITHQKLVGIGRSDPSEALDVLGVTKSTEFVGIGSNLTEILTNYSTTELVEGANLYYTAERVGIIVSSSNVESSNYVDLMDSNMSNYMENRTEYFTLVDSNMSNYMENRTEHFTLVDSNMSNYMENRTEYFTLVDSNMSNYMENRTEYFTLVDSNMSNYLTETSNTISQNLSTLDNLVRTDIQTKLDETSNFAIDMDSNVSNYIQNRTEYFTLVDSNMSNYMTATSNTISQNLSTLDNLVRTDIQTKLDETSNFAIDMDSNVSNYIQNRTEYFTLVDSNMSNYVENRTEYFTLVDSNMSNYVENRTEYFTLVDSNMSNYVENRTEYFTLVDSNMSNYMENRTEHFTLVDSNMSNYMENRTEHFTLVDSNMSNYVENRTEYFTLVDSNMSNYVENRTEYFTLVDSNMSNYVENRTEYFTLVDSNMSNYMTATSNVISDRISKLDTDDITQGVHQKFIVDNVWDNDLTISGTLYTSNIRAVGSNTIIFTDIYTTESLGVVSTAEDSDAFIISHSGDGINNVMTATVADEPAMVITHQKLVGIGRSDPSEALDVLGVTKSTEFVGIGSNLTEILTNYSTTELVEGTNLYYTAERVGIIVSSSNVESSNYVDLMDSNMSNYMENRTEHFTLVDSNMSNYMENRTEYFTLVDSNMSNYMENRTEYFTLVDSNMSNYMENRTEYFTLVDSNMSNYMDNRTEFILEIDSNVSNFVISTEEGASNYIEITHTSLSNYVIETSNVIMEIFGEIKSLDNIDNGTSNRYIRNNTYHDNLYVAGKLMVNEIEIADLDYILEQSHSNIGNFYTYIEAVSSNLVIEYIEDTSNEIIEYVSDALDAMWTSNEYGVSMINSNVGIGTIASATDRLAVTGDVYVDGNVRASGDVVSSYSDSRLKKVVSNIEDPINKILQINTFKYVPSDIAISMNITDMSVQVGVSAQDVQSVLPEIVTLAPFDSSNIDGRLVSCSGNNFLTVAYERLVPLLIEGIKELKKDVDELKSKII